MAIPFWTLANTLVYHKPLPVQQINIFLAKIQGRSYDRFMPLKCPYCFSTIPENPGKKCPSCEQYFLDAPFQAAYSGTEDKKCTFCGKKVHSEARICRHCKKWLDELEQSVDDFKHLEGLEGD